MAQDNLWDLKTLQSRGEEALLSGQVSPEQAASSVDAILKAAGIQTTNPLLRAASMLQPNRKSMKTVNQRVNFVSPEEMNTALDMTRGIPEYQAAAQGSRDLEDLVNRQAAVPSDSYSGPLATLLNYQKTGQWSPVDNQDSPQSRLQKLIAGKAALQKEKLSLSDQLLESLSRQKSGLTTTSTENVEGDTRDSARMAGQQRIKETNLIRDIQGISKPYEDALEQISKAKEATEFGDLQSTMVILSVIAKSVGKDAGALAEGDIARTLPKTWGKTWGEIEAYVTSNPNVLLDKSITGGFKKLLQLTEDKLATKAESRLNTTAETYKAAPSYYDVPVDNIVKPLRDRIKSRQAPNDEKKQMMNELKTLLQESKQ